MDKYVVLNINSILSNVRNYLADIFFCYYKNIIKTKGSTLHATNILSSAWSAALLLYYGGER